MTRPLRWYGVALALMLCPGDHAVAAVDDYAVLAPQDFAHYIQRFNASDEESVANLVPNAQAWEWLAERMPLFTCPAGRFEEIYYFRWWTYRKHLRQTPQGVVLTEFITPVSHAGPYNTVACAVGHHIAEGRWLREQEFLDDYARYWFRGGEDGGPAPHFHRFSSWVPTALYERSLVTGDDQLLRELLDDFVADDRVWESERQLPDGSFWQFDVRDGMEESISGGRREQNVRPTINSYMAANARSIARVAARCGRDDLAAEFSAKSDALREIVETKLWDEQAKFYKVRRPDGSLSDARELIGYLPWRFDLASRGHAEAWRQITDREGFWAPCGLATAERRHPQFRTHGVGTCEWDGAVWPFATSQTLDALQNVLRGPEQPYVTRRDFFEQLLTYAEAQQWDGAAYIGEYYDEVTGKWLITGEKERRSRFYNHSTFNDLVIRGLVGLVPRDDDTIEIDPLLPDDGWDWFCLDGVRYHDATLAIVWDRTGARFGRGAGLILYVNGEEAARRKTLGRLTAQLPDTTKAP
ncbi:MAG: hypothetical protein KDA44_12845 [Planctomycetales bacterium]|nr:hypothetical protein [Planctomycetales bacterium]